DVSRVGLGLALLATLVTVAAAAQVAAPVRDTTATTPARDSAAAGSRPDTAIARADSAAVISAKRDSSVVITTRPTPAKKGAKEVEPPYRIEADKMSGGRGPNGDLL